MPKLKFFLGIIIIDVAIILCNWSIWVDPTTTQYFLPNGDTLFLGLGLILIIVRFASLLLSAGTNNSVYNIRGYYLKDNDLFNSFSGIKFNCNPTLIYLNYAGFQEIINFRETLNDIVKQCENIANFHVKFKSIYYVGYSKFVFNYYSQKLVVRDFLNVYNNDMYSKINQHFELTIDVVVNIYGIEFKKAVVQNNDVSFDLFLETESLNDYIKKHQKIIGK
jgi:hypothetical protein